MSTAPAAVARPSLRQIQAYTGQNGGPEQFDNFAYAPLGVRNVPKPVPLDQPLMAFQFEWKGDIVIADHDYTSVFPESLLNIFQNIKWTGKHASFSSQTPWDGSGATLFKLMKLCQVKGNDLYINGVRLSDDVLSNGIPLATFGAEGTYHVDLIMTVPVYPFGLGDSQALLFYYNEQSWGSTINMTLNMGDATSFGVPDAATVVTFGGFNQTDAGVVNGNALVNVQTVYASLGPLATKIGQAVCVRSDQQINSVLQSNSATIRLAILQNQRTNWVIVKTGTIAATGSGNQSSFVTLSDTIMEQTLLRKNNARIRDLYENSATKSWYNFRMNTVQPIGYLGLFFDDGTPSTNSWAAYQGDNPAVLPAGAQFDVAAQIVGADDDNAGEVIQEYTLGEPVVAV